MVGFTNNSGGQPNFGSSKFDKNDDWDESWLFRLALGSLSYACVAAPVLFFAWLANSRKWFDRDRRRASRPWWYRWLEALTVGTSVPTADDGRNEDDSDWLRRRLGDGWALLFACSAGLMVSYLGWGVLQERLMTTPYRLAVPAHGVDRTWSKFVYQRFADSQFVVLCNRAAALLLAAACTLALEGGRTGGSPPSYRYLYAALSNVAGSWCQYESLKYIAFPVQVLGKASKIVPTMLMGALVERKTYRWHHYATGACVSVGVSLFLLLGSDEPRGRRRWAESNSTTFSGVALLLGYLLCDSFTTNWQAALYHRYCVSSVRMMRGVNFFGFLLAAAAVSTSGRFGRTLNAVAGDPQLLVDLLLTSLCSAVGQLFIFYTIARFGAVAFAAVMTTRQAISAILSCWIFGHRLTPLGHIGLLFAFGALLTQRCLVVVTRRRPVRSKEKMTLV